MATTFEVLFLGTAAEIDPTEGNLLAENASSLVGQTFGGHGAALAYQQHTFSPVDYSGGDSDRYNIDNTVANDTFSIDGGAAQTFDGLAVYNATLSYTDGTPDASITAVVFQDASGNLYLAPESSANADYSAMIAAPIESLTLNSMVTISRGNLLANRQFTDFVCFTAGTMILTPQGERPVETLAPGDQVVTLDNGVQPVRWVGRRRLHATARHPPIRLRAGALGNRRDLVVSPQHRILLSGWQAELWFGTPEILVPAKALVNDLSIRPDPAGPVTYLHLLFDRHEIVLSNGIATESFFPGDAGLDSLSDPTREELFALFPELRSGGGPARETARLCLRPREAAALGDPAGLVSGALFS